MKVLIDGKEVQVQNDVKIIYDGVCIDIDSDTDTDILGELHATMTSEGMILDVIDTEGEVCATYATEYGQMASWCE